MNNINLQKIEEISLSIFKIVVIALLSVTLVAILGLILKGVIDYTQKPDTTTPRQEASPPKAPPPIGVDPNNFLEKFLPKTAVPPQVDNSDKILSGYMDKLWGHFDNYQKQCESPLPVDKNTFDAAFPKQIVKEWLKRFGEPFLASQDQFAKIVLSNLKLIEFCKEKKGKSGVFLVLLEWHKDEWNRQVNSNEMFIASERERIAEFNQKESQRIKNFKVSEEFRISEQRLEAIKLFWAALFGYGLFISLAILLLLARIAHNWLVRKEIKQVASPGLS